MKALDLHSERRVRSTGEVEVVKTSPELTPLSIDALGRRADRRLVRGRAT
jgi:hypothetical protein